MGVIKIACQNRIFSPSRSETKLIEYLFPLGLEDDVMTMMLCTALIRHEGENMRFRSIIFG